jgi:hypothetical protein
MNIRQKAYIRIKARKCGLLFFSLEPLTGIELAICSLRTSRYTAEHQYIIMDY